MPMIFHHAIASHKSLSDTYDQVWAYIFKVGKPLISVQTGQLERWRSIFQNSGRFAAGKDSRR